MREASILRIKGTSVEAIAVGASTSLPPEPTLGRVVRIQSNIGIHVGVVPQLNTPTGPATYSTYRMTFLTGGSNVYGIGQVGYLDASGTFQAATSAAATETNSSSAQPSAIIGATPESTPYWYTNDNASGQTFSISYPAAFAAASLTMTPPAPAAGWTPLTVAVYGSNDGVTFTEVGTVTFQPWAAGVSQTVAIVPVASAGATGSTGDAPLTAGDPIVVRLDKGDSLTLFPMAGEPAGTAWVTEVNVL